MKPDDEIHRANRAEQILNDPLVKEALEAIHDRIIEEWRGCPVKDVEMREKLWMMFNMHHRFISAMKEHIDTGKLARATITEEAKRRDYFESLKDRFNF